MQIRTIRGRNLASLANDFEIDLTAEPLASAGLFAITGETGAGKSTILDAMCLALYGDCPRLSDNGINDDIPDAAGGTIKSKDTRAILRRGAATGYAEVEFVAPDGVAYRVRWSTRRARNRADGRLQKSERALIRLSDEQVLESQVSAVNARVAEITGLQYAEFMRTMLLAQGDFDAFLVAGTGERAALLEKVTGTHVYREISRRIYARHDEAKNALSVLENRRSGVIALSDEQRSTLSEEQATLLAEIQSLTVAIAGQTNKIQVHEKITAAQHRVDAARTAETQAKQDATAATSDRDKLVRLDEALGLRTGYERAVRAAKNVARLLEDENTTVARQSELAAQAAEADTRYRKTKTALEDSERLVLSLEPTWAKATDLDGQIRTAADEQQRAEAALDAASKTASMQTTELDKLTRQRADQATVRDNADKALAQEPGAQRLADAWDHVSGLIDERIEVTARIREKHEAAQAAQAKTANAESRLEELAASNRADQATITEQEDTIRVARQRLEEIRQTDPGPQITRLAATDTAVKDMIRAVGEHEQANEAREKAGADQAAADTARQSAGADASAAEKQIARATAAVHALTAPVDRAEAAASDQAAHLRQHLVDGDACPVCGATEHPVSANEALAGIAHDMRLRLEAERKALAEATDDETQATRQDDAARLAIDAAAENHKTAEDRIATAEAMFAEARTAAVETAQGPLPNGPLGSADALNALRKQIEADRLRFAALSEEETRLRGDIDRQHLQTAGRRGTIENRDATRVAQEKIRNDNAAAASLARQAAAHATERCETIDGQLAPVLAGVDRTPAIIDDKPQEARSALERIVHAYHKQLAMRDTARDAIAELGPQISAAETARQNADTAVATAKTALENRRATLLACRDERGQLLDGEDTETHRVRHNQARTHAQKSHAEASEALSALRSEKTGKRQASMNGWQACAKASPMHTPKTTRRVPCSKPSWTTRA